MNVRRALVVEDQEVFACSVCAALSTQMGVSEVRAVETLAAALEMLAGFEPELVLLDLGLPDGSGLGLLDEVAKLEQRPTVIVVTVFDDDEHLFEAVRRGADGYVLKEESGADLVRLLEGVLEGRPPLSGSIARRILEHLRSSEALEPAFTEREEAVVRLLAGGATVAGAARKLGISAHTVQHHVKSVYRKLNVHSRAELTRAAIDLGLL